MMRENRTRIRDVTRACDPQSPTQEVEMNATAHPRSRALLLAIGVMSATPALVVADGTMKDHMAVQNEMRRDADLAGLPSLQIDPITAEVPLDDRLKADDAFDRPFVDELRDGMSWYLAERGVRVVESGADLRLAAAIDSYEGWKGWGHWGVDVKLQAKLFRGTDLVLSETLRFFHKYPNDEKVEDEEKPKYKAHHLGKASFDEILFTRVGAELSEKLITLLKERAKSLSPAPAAAVPGTPGGR
jgi:hypothetical protein